MVIVYKNVKSMKFWLKNHVFFVQIEHLQTNKTKNVILACKTVYLAQDLMIVKIVEANMNSMKKAVNV